MYSGTRWSKFDSMRRDAARITQALQPWQGSMIVHGSLARGDVDQHSDIDVLIEEPVITQLVESRLESRGFPISGRDLVQATPVHSPKAHIYLDPQQLNAVTIPLLPLRTLENEFYRFGGAIRAGEIDHRQRVPGCTKQLTLIQPTSRGHIESSIVGQEVTVARALGISTRIVEERIRVLQRRDKIGRTGVFLRIPVPDEATFEETLANASKNNPALNRTIRLRSR